MSSNQSDGAVVTGAASGIGRAIAAGLATDGFSVVVADLDEANGRAAAKEIAASNQGRVIFQRVDVTDRSSVSAAIDACIRQFGSIKVMVNNQQAGTVPRGKRGNLAQDHGRERAWGDDRHPGSR
jgi:meso-butanediol dehydrogenase/(S,S)-butanediol dehydrogenase/diacetyl reductase